ncbi:uncharacterized protein LOC113226799 [Hyposmocoma kahamanoa]|uniref:uncharacterized protein LOC113226799 n=1 Tax=Hyposmocoma kahamanoa TaxID=1477025 RepID=UPI000E6D7107|nr:uncharacterized protein LOC113226799 [Hyposmocoma kahamanoa]
MWHCAHCVIWTDGGQMKGGFNTVKTDDPDVVRAAKAAVAAHKPESAVDRFRYDDCKITKAEKQVVNGYNYRLKITCIYYVPLDITAVAECDALVYNSITSELAVKKMKCEITGRIG